MNILTKPETIRTERCPYLGLHDDDSTSLAYASPWNYCYHASPPAPISMEHQVQACLCAQYVVCPVLLSGKRGRFPRRLREKTRLRLGDVAWLLLLVALAAILVVLLFYGQLLPF